MQYLALARIASSPHHIKGQLERNVERTCSALLLVSISVAHAVSSSRILNGLAFRSVGYPNSFLRHTHRLDLQDPATSRTQDCSVVTSL
eukprot:scaffold125934_cov31-Tisochrysis_lutea.AAC.1